MEKCIRDEDGTEVSPSEWRAIKKSANLLVNTYLKTLQAPADPSAKTRSKTKTYYAKYFPQIWSDVLEKLERQEPLVRLCAAHWKADHIIGNCLQAIIEDDRKKKRNIDAQPADDSDSEDRLNHEDVEPELQPPKPRGHKRAPEEFLEAAKKKKRPKVKRGTAAVGVLTREGPISDESMREGRWYSIPLWVEHM